MSIRAFAAFWSVLLLLFTRSALAQSTEIDEFDLGDEWVDSADDREWFAPFSPTIATDTAGFRLDLSGGIGIATHQDLGESALDSAPARQSTRQDYYALATLEVPFDHLFSGGSGYAASQGPSEEVPLVLAQYADTNSEQREPKRRSRSADEDAGQSEALADSPEGAEKVPGAEQEESAETPEDPTTVEPQQFTAEETVLVAREIADRVAGTLDGADARIRSLVRRSRWSGLSPELRLRGVLGFDRATSTEESVGIYAGDTTVRGGRDSLAEVRLTFRLDRLVLGEGESSLERQRIELAEDRRKLIKEALDVFSVWRLSQVRGQDVSLSPDERLEATIDAESALAELYLLTDGWFQGTKTLRTLSREIPHSGRTRAEKSPVQ